jgi:hypothetical protein
MRALLLLSALVVAACGPAAPDTSLLPAGTGWQCAAETVAMSGGPTTGACHRSCDFAARASDGSVRTASCTALERAWCFTTRMPSGVGDWHCADVAERCRSWRDDTLTGGAEASECAELP